MSKPSTFQPQVESLEHRNLPSAQMIGATLQVDGAAGNDYLRVSQSSDKISVYGTTITDGTTRAASIDAGRVAKIVVNGGAGNDIVIIDASIAKETSISTGAGDDQIWGGSGNDTIDAGAGNDAIYAGAGSDRLKGGDAITERDTLNGGTGFDWYYRPFNASTPVVNGAVVSDVKQGEAPMCQTVAALAEAAKQGHNFAADIRYQGSASYQVQLRGNLSTRTVKYDGWTNDNDPVTTGGDFWTTLMQRGRLQALGIDTSREYSMAQWNALNQSLGGRLYSIGDAVYNFTGNTSVFTDMTKVSATTLQAALAHGDAVVAVSRPVSGISADGIIGNHAYAVLAVYQEANVWKVRLYNPWGRDRDNGATLDSLDRTRPAANDGFITLTWAQFTSSNNFKSVFTARATETQAAAFRASISTRE